MAPCEAAKELDPFVPFRRSSPHKQSHAHNALPPWSCWNLRNLAESADIRRVAGVRRDGEAVA